MTARHPMAAAAASPAQAQATAEAVREAMSRDDAVIRLLGLEVVTIGPGSARVSMQVRSDMLNGFGICHGGLIATLADAAFAYACNAYNVQTVASGFSVELLAGAHEGDRLVAVAREVSRKGRLGVYDIEVDDQHGRRIALFRGHSYTMAGRPVVGGSPLNPRGG